MNFCTRCYEGIRVFPLCCWSEGVARTEATQRAAKAGDACPPWSARELGRDDPAECDRALNAIHQEAKRAGQIMRKVRELVDNRKPRTASTNIHALLGSVRRICEIHALASRVPIDIHIDERVTTVDVDAVQLQQVLVNLVTNAIEASADLPDDRKQVTVDAADEDAAPLAADRRAPRHPLRSNALGGTPKRCLKHREKSDGEESPQLRAIAVSDGRRP